jgi:hypothetical protein
MHIKIEDETVSDNIRSFLTLLRKEEAKREKKGAVLMESIYKAFLNRKSGKIVFLESHKEQTDLSGHDWKPICIVYSFDPLVESFHAIAYESDHQEEGFALTDLAPSAVTAIKGTIHILNKLSSLVKGPGSDAVTKIKAICKLQIDVGSVEEGKNIVVAAWHTLDRIGAEKLLKNMPVGTYFFREDGFAKILSQQLTEELGKEVCCITLTVLELNQKVADYTLVHIDHLWRLYDDALFCDVRGFSKVEDLLDEKFFKILKEPLYHTYLEEQIG